MVLRVSETLAGILGSNSKFGPMICSLVFCEPQAPRWTSAARACAHEENPSSKTRGGEIRHRGFTLRKNNKCRNPSHSCAPQRNLSPPLRFVALAWAHVPTDRRRIRSHPKGIAVLQIRFHNLFCENTCVAGNHFPRST